MTCYTIFRCVHPNLDAHLARKFKNNDVYNLEFREKLVGLAIKWEGLERLHVGKLRYMYDPVLWRERAMSVAREISSSVTNI